MYLSRINAVGRKTAAQQMRAAAGKKAVSEMTAGLHAPAVKPSLVHSREIPRELRGLIKTKVEMWKREIANGTVPPELAREMNLPDNKEIDASKVVGP